MHKSPILQSLYPVLIGTGFVSDFLLMNILVSPCNSASQCISQQLPIHDQQIHDSTPEPINDPYTKLYEDILYKLYSYKIFW